MGVLQSIGLLVPRMRDMIQSDSEMVVAMSCLESLTTMLKECRSLVLKEDTHLPLIVAAVTLVFQGKTACQDGAGDDDDADDDDEEESAEQEAMLFEYAGEVLPALISASTMEAMTPLINSLLPLLIKKTKKSCSVAERSFSVGTMSEMVVALEGNVSPWVPTLLAVFYAGIADEDEEVRSNAAYGLGVLPYYAKDMLYPQYQKILGSLSTLLSKEEFPRCIDNIAAAVARLIIAGMDHVPLDVVFPGIVKCLPLKEDNEENGIVYE